MTFDQAKADRGKLQALSQESNQLTICPFLEGRRGEANLQGPIVASDDLVGGGSRLNMDRQSQHPASFGDQDFFRIMHELWSAGGERIAA
jgi:hypothetical protein